jgi:hypothetical protein
MIDLTMAIQLGWTDLMTVAKHQGFGVLTIVSEEQPAKMEIGINKAVWLKQVDGRATPSISYTQSQSPLDQYKGLLMDLTALLLTTNDMSPSSVGGTGSTKNYTSGFQALIENSDILEALEGDKPIFIDAEREVWEIIEAWHTYLLESGTASDEIKALGPISKDFEVQVQFAESTPLESETEIVDRITKLEALGLITKKDALKRLYPDLNNDEIESKIEELKAEKESNTPHALAVNSTIPQAYGAVDSTNQDMKGTQTVPSKTQVVDGQG